MLNIWRLDSSLIRLKIDIVIPEWLTMAMSRLFYFSISFKKYIYISGCFTFHVSPLAPILTEGHLGSMSCDVHVSKRSRTLIEVKFVRHIVHMHVYVVCLYIAENSTCHTGLLKSYCICYVNRINPCNFIYILVTKNIF